MMIGTGNDTKLHALGWAADGALGAEVRVAYDGPTALVAVSAFQPEVVLLDIGMPGMDGFEVARRIRLHPKSRKVTLIALTGWGQEKDRRDSEAAGFDHHLIKPVDMDALQGLLAAVHQRSNQKEKSLEGAKPGDTARGARTVEGGR
jgi:CheY-like chemotaxis protein